MLKLLWYIISIINIVLILMNSPLSNNMSNIGNDSTMFSVTRSNQVRLQIVISIFTVIFLISTVYHVLYN